MTDSIELKVPKTDRSDFDPIDWAIVAIIIAGTSLLLSIDQKLNARRKADAEDAEKKAISGNQLRLSKIKRHVDHLKLVLSNLSDLGKIVVHEDKSGITRSSIEFSSEDAEEEFNNIFDGTTHGISRLNRLISEIDLEGLPLDDKDLDEIARQIEGIKESTNSAIHPDSDPNERLKLAERVLSRHIELIESLEAILNGHM